MPRRKLQKGNYEDKYGRQYQNCEVNRKDVFQIERYYRWNKFIPQFKRTILRLKNMCKSDYKPFLCVFHALTLRMLKTSTYMRTEIQRKQMAHADNIFEPNHLSLKGNMRF